VWSGANRDHRNSVGFRKRRRQLRDVDGGSVRVCRWLAGIDEANLHTVVITSRL